MVIPVTLDERLGILASLRRSAALTVGSRVPIFFAIAIICVLQFGLQYLMLQVTGADTDRKLIFVADMPHIHFWLPLIRASASIFMSLGAVLPAVMYHQLRAAKEAHSDLAAARVMS